MVKRADADFEYDVALSFAGEQREYVQRVAHALRTVGVRPFYDEYEKAELWGKDLYEHLDYIYQRAARFCVIFASKDYAEKVWTRQERRSAQARAIDANSEYILPARFDDTAIPGVRSTVGYIDLSGVSPEELAALIRKKLGPRVRRNFFPPQPDRLFHELGFTGVEADYVLEIARSFAYSLRRTTVEERRLLFEVFTEGCISELPENVHVSLDLVRRDLQIPPAEALALLRGLSSLGFETRERTSGGGEEHDEADMVELSWSDFTSYEDEPQDEFSMEHSTAVARAVILGTSADRCLECAFLALDALDFSALSTSLDEDVSHPRKPH